MITESGFEIIGGCKVYEYEVACPNYTRAKKAGGFFAAVLALFSAFFCFSRKCALHIRCRRGGR